MGCDPVSALVSVLMNSPAAASGLQLGRPFREMLMTELSNPLPGPRLHSPLLFAGDTLQEGVPAAAAFAFAFASLAKAPGLRGAASGGRATPAGRRSDSPAPARTCQAPSEPLHLSSSHSVRKTTAITKKLSLSQIKLFRALGYFGIGEPLDFLTWSSWISCSEPVLRTALSATQTQAPVLKIATL